MQASRNIMCHQPCSQGLSSQRLGRARRDPGRVWSRVSQKSENPREGSSVSKEFVALSFVEFKARLIALRHDSAITRDVLQ